MRAAIAALGASGMIAAAAANAEPAKGPLNRKPEWLKQPSAESLLAVLPAEAVRKGVDGSALIRCIVTLQGRLRDCHVLKETPPAVGYGAAALALSSQFLLQPGLKNGVPYETEVIIPIAWRDVGTQRAYLPAFPKISDRTLANIVWSSAPSVADVSNAYPKRARARKVSGHVVLSCSLNAKGALTDCIDTVVEPTSYGFETAARELAKRFVGPTKTQDGTPLTGVHTLVPFTFDAETLASPSPEIGKPHWTALPTGEEFTRSFPEAASKAGIDKARVVMNCTVADGGALTGCQIVSEDPPGYGLGQGAAGLAKSFKVTVWTEEGLPTIGGTVRVPIRYDFSQPPPAAPSTPAPAPANP